MKISIGQAAINVAIPLGQGQVFNGTRKRKKKRKEVAIPLGQGQVFNAIVGFL